MLSVAAHAAPRIMLVIDLMLVSRHAVLGCPSLVVRSRSADRVPVVDLVANPKHTPHHTFGHDFEV